MKNTHVSLAIIPSLPDVPAIAVHRATPIHELFVELVQILEQIKDGSRATGDDGSMDRWEDDEYVYLQTDLEAIFGSEIDINVHDGRFYVRVER